MVPVARSGVGVDPLTHTVVLDVWKALDSVARSLTRPHQQHLSLRGRSSGCEHRRPRLSNSHPDEQSADMPYMILSTLD